jgi:hypothetical protein
MTPRNHEILWTDFVEPALWTLAILAVPLGLLELLIYVAR